MCCVSWKPSLAIERCLLAFEFTYSAFVVSITILSNASHYHDIREIFFQFEILMIEATLFFR